MAIIYKSGNRLVDTGRTPSYSTDFSTTVSDNNIASDNSDWTSTDSSNTDVANERIEATLDSSGDSIQYYVSNSNADIRHNTQISDEQWLLRFSVEWVTQNADSAFYFGCDGTNNALSDTTCDSMSLYWEHTSSNQRWGLHQTNGATKESEAALDYQDRNARIGHKYYFELVRTSAVQGEVRLYSDSTYTAIVQKSVGTTSSSNYAHRYIRFSSKKSGNTGTSTIRIDDVKLYDQNGKEFYDNKETPFIIKSSPKPSPEKFVDGTVLIEQQTGKEYILNNSHWKQKPYDRDSGGGVGSISELLTNQASVKKQHIWDWFSGSSLSSIWSWTAGTGGTVISQGMIDEVDGGYQLRMTNGHIGTYDFNNNRQYNHDGAIIIGVCKRMHSDGIFGIGFKGDKASAGSYIDSRTTRLLIRNGTSTIQGMTADSSSATYHDTGVTSDTNWHTLKIELTSGATHFSVDGILRDSSTGSENETDEKVQPMFYSSTAGSSQGGNIRYLEAYNT